MTYPTDRELFEFDKSCLACWDPARACVALRDEGALYRNHLLVARWLEDYADRLADDHEHDGYVLGVRDICAHLRQADFVPGGVLHDEFLAEIPASVS